MFAARCAALLLVAACGSPQPAPPDPDPAEVPPADAAPPPPPPVTRSCLPEDAPEMALDAGPGSDAGPTPQSRIVSGRELHRISGDDRIIPDPFDRRLPFGRKALLVIVKVCLDTSGRVSSVKLMNTSGKPGYDDKVRRAVSCWRYRPVVVGGQPVAVCTVITFLYRPSPPAFSPPR